MWGGEGGLGGSAQGVDSAVPLITTLDSRRGGTLPHRPGLLLRRKHSKEQSRGEKCQEARVAIYILAHLNSHVHTSTLEQSCANLKEGRQRAATSGTPPESNVHHVL